MASIQGEFGGSREKPHAASKGRRFENHRLLPVALLLLSACSSRCGEGAAPPGPTVEVPGLDALTHRPLIVVREGMPVFTLYEDGLLIYHRGEFVHGAELRAEMGRAAAASLAHEITAMGFFDLPLHERLSDATDQPNVYMLVRDGVRWHSASVYGNLRGRRLPGDRRPSSTFARAYRRLVTLDPPGAVPWIPEQLDVRLTVFGHARTSVPWPATIPAPPSPARPNGVMTLVGSEYTIDGKYEPEARAFGASLRGSVAVESNGFKWSFGYHRRLPETAYVDTVERAIDDHL